MPPARPEIIIASCVLAGRDAIFPYTSSHWLGVLVLIPTYPVDAGIAIERFHVDMLAPAVPEGNVYKRNAVESPEYPPISHAGLELIYFHAPPEIEAFAANTSPNLCEINIPDSSILILSVKERSEEHTSELQSH